MTCWELPPCCLSQLFIEKCRKDGDNAVLVFCWLCCFLHEEIVENRPYPPFIQISVELGTIEIAEQKL